MRLVIISVVLFLNCYLARATNNPEGTVQEVRFCDLAKNPAAFSGKRIRVRAIYRYAFEIDRLESSTCCPDLGAKIWVEIEPGLEGSSRKFYQRFPKGTGVVLATFAGTFESGGTYGTFADKYKLTVDQIEKVEQTARSSRKQDDPTWVPKNCEASATPVK